MVKTKNKKKNLAEHINNKKKGQNTKTLNPFEVHINREKMKVLGRRQKNDRGLPGVSRAKALKKRKSTLLQEYSLQHKSNRFIDKRIGERNIGLTEEDRAMARFAAVRTKAHKRKSIFNLADDEVLTHQGQTLNEIEKFDDPRSDDEDSLDDQQTSGKLDSDFVEDAHFGGGILSKTGIEGAKSHKDLINQLIAESKKRKAEKQKAKEKTLELTEKLDTEWKDLIPVVSRHAKSPNESLKSEANDYDKVIHELRFEARGHPSDRLKTEDEIAKEEKEKLEILESERLARMKGFFEEKPTSTKHRSADDLDDDFAYDSDPDVMLSYNEKGESNIIQTEFATLQEDEENAEKEEIEGESSSNEIETASEDDFSDLLDENSDSDVEKDENEETSEDKSSNAVTNESENSHFTLKGKLSEDLSNNIKENIKISCSSSLQHNISKEEIEQHFDKNQKFTVSKVRSEVDQSDKIKADLLKRKEMMEKARQELPYMFNLPESYEELQEVLRNHTPEHQSVIIERMVKCNHPSLNAGNKDKLGMLFAYLLQYVDDLAIDKDIMACFKIFYNIVPQLFDLAQLNQENTQRSLAEVIKEKHMEYRKNHKVYPGLNVLLFLKIVSCLFPTSDFRHQVVTPSIAFMDQMLYKCKVRTRKDIAYGLFLVSLILEYTALSKRYLPAAINFLAGILHMAIPKTAKKLKVLPPFQSASGALVLFKNCRLLPMPLKLEASDLAVTEITEDFKIRALHTTLKLVREFSNNFKQFPSNCEIFLPILQYLGKIPVCNYPEEVQNEIRDILGILNRTTVERRLEYIVVETQRPKALRLYEPNIEKVYDGKKYRVTSKEKAEREKLLHKIKREQKGALREIRRDKAFLGRIKIKQKIQGDKQRQEKVKRIFAEASVQQSELNSLNRKNKRRK